MPDNVVVIMILTALRSSVSLRHSNVVVSRIWRRSTMSSLPVTAAPIRVTTAQVMPVELQIARAMGNASVDCRALDDLALKVVQGTANKVWLKKLSSKHLRLDF